MSVEKEDLEILRTAKKILENPSMAAKITNAIGKPVEIGMELLPEKWNEVVGDATKKALLYSLEGALITMDKNIVQGSNDFWHKIIVASTGAGGGLFGLPALAVELPVSTTIMLRSIADIARSEGEDLKDQEVKLNCLSVFALGGRSTKDDAAESGYYAVRSALAKTISEAAKYIAEKGLTEEGAPALVRFISSISSRFSIQVTEKGAAQAVAAVGAIGGAVINLIFIDHFQNMARGHFSVRRLERKYNPEIIQKEYENLDLRN